MPFIAHHEHVLKVSASGASGAVFWEILNQILYAGRCGDMTLSPCFRAMGAGLSLLVVSLVGATTGGVEDAMIAWRGMVMTVS